MTIPAIRLKVAALALAATVLAAGCAEAPKVGEVTGKVTIKGKAPNIEGLAINFLGADGQPATFPVALDGSYQATGLLAGPSKVGFSVPGSGGGAAAGKPAPGTKAAPPPKAAKPPIAEQYHDPNQSNLNVTVVSGKSTPFDIDLP